MNARKMQSLAIGIDLGCTNIKGVLLDDEGNILHEAKTDTNEQDDRHWKDAIREMVADFTAKSQNKISAIGLSAPGLADSLNTCISFMPERLPGLANFNWTAWLGAKVIVVNDAHAAMMAEATFGAAKGLQHAILLSLGTGVGGGLLINGELFQGISQMAGHIGHTTTDAETCWRDITNMPGSIEDAFGNATLPTRSYGKYTSTEELVRDYEKGNHLATLVWLTSLRKLAVTIASAINMISPEAVILSGGITQAEEALLGPLQDFLALYEWRPGGKKTPIKLALFSDRAGAIGAAGFALSKLK